MPKSVGFVAIAIAAVLTTACSIVPKDGRPGFRLPGDNGSGKPDSFYGFSLGVGLLTGQRISLDAAYQLRYGTGVNADHLRGIDGNEEDVFQHRFVFSTVVSF